MPATTKKPQDHKPKAKGGFGRKKLSYIDVPSGSTIGVVRPGVQGLVRAGILESFDQLTAIVSSEVIPAAEGQPRNKLVDARTLLKDPDKIKQATEMMDKIVMFVVEDPKLAPSPTLTEEDKAAGKTIDDLYEEDVAYIDYVEDEDKAFIMNYVLGGTSDLARFREESAEVMGDLSDVQVSEQGTI